MKKFIAFVLMFMSVLVFIGCKDDLKKEVLPESIKITSDAKEVAVGETLELKAKVIPSNATNKALTWLSRDEEIATVNKSGKVKGIAKGEVVITVSIKDTDIKAEITINVVEVLPESIKITSGAKEVEVGETLELEAEVLPSNATNKALTWLSSNEEIATVSESGKVTGKAKGEVDITVSIKNTDIKAEITIKVVEAGAILDEPAEKISITGEPAMEIGESMQLYVTFVPEGSDRELIWSSSDEEIATVSESGKVTGKAKGTVTIKAVSVSDPEVFAEYEIQIDKEIKIIDLQFEFEGEEIVIGFEFPFKTKTIPEEARKLLVYTSNNEEVAVVNNKGVVKALSEGEVTITVKAKTGDLEKSVTVRVVPQPELEDFEITGARNIGTGEILTLKLKTTPEYADTSDVEWSVDDPTIAEIDETGKVKPLKAGTITVKASHPTAGEKTCEIVIQPPFDPHMKPTSVIVSGPDSCYLGLSIQLKASVLPAGVSQLVTWKVNPEDYATIDENGLLKAIKKGTVRIKACSKADEKVCSSWFRITLSIAPEPPAPTNMGGYEIVIMNADSALKDLDPFLKTDEGDDAYKGSDKIYKQRAWREIQEKFNCRLLVKPYPASAPWGPSRVAWLQEKASAKQSECDFATVAPAWLYKFVQTNTALETTEYFKRYGNKQITTTQREAGSYRGKLYIVSTGLSKSTIFPYKGLFYNYGMIRKLNLESPAKLFNEGRWSFDDFTEYCIKTQAVMPEGYHVMSGGPSIMWAGMVNACGISIADKIKLDLNLTHQYSLDAIAALRKVVEADAWAIDNIGYDAENEPFQSGQALFQPGEYWFVHNDNRFPSDLWGDDTQYGYVPFPYSPSVGKENTMVNALGESMLMMVTGRNYPANVSAEDVFRAVQEMYLNTIKYQEEDPTYDPEQLKITEMTKRIEDPESIAATIYFRSGQTLYDPLFEESFQYEWGGETTTAIINSVKGKDMREELDRIYESVRTKFLDVYAQ